MEAYRRYNVNGTELKNHSMLLKHGGGTASKPRSEMVSMCEL